jgi:hypothetical protein
MSKNRTTETKAKTAHQTVDPPAADVVEIDAGRFRKRLGGVTPKRLRTRQGGKDVRALAETEARRSRPRSAPAAPSEGGSRYQDPLPGPGRIDFSAATPARPGTRDSSANTDRQYPLLGPSIGTAADADAVRQYTALGATDEVESIMDRHIVAMSLGALECQRQAILTGQPKNMVMYYRHAEKMTQILVQLVDARERRRTPRKPFVVNVNVNSGGQAIVAQIEAARKDDQEEPDEEPAERTPEKKRSDSQG